MKRILSRVVLVGVIACSWSLGQGQNPRLLNASFEGEPRDASMPRGWRACAEGTTPDIMPGPWGVYTEPYDGKSYVGLISRENGTRESMGQKLMTTLKSDQCYYMSMMLAQSKAYMGYNEPVKLRVWGGQSKCDRDVLIGETDFIEHTEWRRYNFEFAVEDKMNFIIIEVFVSDEPFSRQGNVLIDQVSEIRRCGRS